MRTTTRPATRPGPARRRHRGAAFVAVNTEWDTLCRSSRARRALRAWRLGRHGAVFAEVGSLDEIVDAHAACTSAEESDRWLVPLVELAAGGDDVAARVVLQAMLATAIGLYRGGGVEEQWNVVAVLGEQIARYPLDTHPTRVFGHLRFMCRRALYRQRRRRQLPTCPLDTDADHGNDGDRPSVLDRFPVEGDQRTSFEQVAARIVDVLAAGDLDTYRASLVLAVAAGHRVGELAAEAGCHHSVMSRRIGAATTTLARANPHPSIDRSGIPHPTGDTAGRLDHVA